MLDELRQIDVSAIAELVRIKQEEELLSSRLSKMETSKEKVSRGVYDRVRSDYQSRQAALDVESRPLKQRARQQYAKLRALRAEIEKTLETASLDKEELIFRHDLGEFQDEEFQTRLSQSETLLAARRQELAEIDQLKQQFIDAFHTESDLEPQAGEDIEELAAADKEEADQEKTRVSSPTPIAPPAGSAPEATMVAQKSALGVTAAIDPAATRPDTVIPPAAGVTARVAIPRIVKQAEEGPAEEFALTPGTTSIGRSPKNQISLPFAEVSRHHANVVFTADGYRIVDLNSGNGILVNGRRVTDWLLNDGDVIQIGMEKLTFRT
ncbi:MAG TPA: FHA domain-containing protein [Thermoanaerobaculia bacterium]|nr:FHA domain-containing protein [Thermoanaerobaculia bacterium]